MRAVGEDRAEPLSDPASASLVERIARGDAAAEAELLDLFRERVLTMLVVRTRDGDAARELAQETMIAVIAALRDGRIREPAKLAGFVHGVARNLANNHIRLRARERDRRSELEDDSAVVQPEDSVEAAERLALMKAAIARLPPIDRRILLLTLVSGWQPGAIAESLGLGAAVVRTRKSRALQKVQDFIHSVTRSPGRVPPRR